MKVFLSKRKPPFPKTIGIGPIIIMPLVFERGAPSNSAASFSKSFLKPNASFSFVLL
ncbi:hypothetical protein [Methanimicrococcus hongohii]|uniref:hypothetical protein n=1 Tax=Methanimicrococcus hongohii TaxID=3028295 RepID=UPI00292EFB51|nr:hypothetical protein [Methanimicrococcus sp. Hf6]